jgi:hypothetical protein
VHLAAVLLVDRPLQQLVWGLQCKHLHILAFKQRRAAHTHTHTTQPCAY